MTNPFRTYEGFGIRVNYVVDAIRTYGDNPKLKANYQRINNDPDFHHFLTNCKA